MATITKKPVKAPILKKQGFLKNNMLIIGAALFVTAASFSGLYAYGASNGDKKVQATACSNAEACISLTNVAEPNIVTIKNGSYVQFNSADNKKHNLFVAHSGSQHSDDHEDEVYASGDFSGDEAWRVQFKKDGAYTFQDKYNSDSTINVVVYTEGKDYKIQ